MELALKNDFQKTLIVRNSIANIRAPQKLLNKPTGRKQKFHQWMELTAALDDNIH